jgi:photosystem II stability/assembly factor-like uncharacterized protein
MQHILLSFAFIFVFQFTAHAQWESKNINTSASLAGVDFLDAETGYVVGGGKIFKTSTGGDQWDISYDAGSSVFLEDVRIAGNRVVAVGKDFNTGLAIILLTTTGGANWKIVMPPTSDLLRSVFFTSNEVGYCAGGGSILKTTDGGNTWQNLPTGGVGGIQSIFFVNDLMGIAVGGSPFNGFILKTQDGGNNWTQIDAPSDEYLQSTFFVNQDVGYAVGWNGKIIKTTDCGATWTSQNSVAMNGNLEVVFTDYLTGYIVGGGISEALIQKTTNGGELWEEIGPQIPQGLICIDFPNFNTGYAVGANGTVLKTESGGTSSLSQLFNSASLQVYPNPVAGMVSVESLERISYIRLFDTNGQLLETRNCNENVLQFDCTHLVPNVYYLEIQTTQGKSIRKIVKQ